MKKEDIEKMDNRELKKELHDIKFQITYGRGGRWDMNYARQLEEELRRRNKL